MAPSTWPSAFILRLRLAIAVLAMLSYGGVGSREGIAAGPPPQQSFASPDEAVQALIAANKAGDIEALAAILGSDAKDLISSGDPVADKEGRARFIRAYERANKLEHPTETKAVLVIGQDKWPLPIPVVREGDVWRFDTAAGKEEILNRRIGRNELNTIQVCLAYVDAQRDYARVTRGDDGLLTYAMKFRSEEGKRDGLYWPTKEGEEPSPLGLFAANAKAEGYTRETSEAKPIPYHGYVYRILTAQGSDAPGGAYNYVVKGRMIGGFALVAYPVQYGVSGIMSFIVNHQGIVYEKDLGRNTESIARAMQAYNPDPTWKKTEASPPPLREGDR